MTKNQWIADGLLLAAAIIWGSAFAVVKNALDSVPPSMMIALRFGIAALISGVILRKHLRGLTRGQVLMGLLCNPIEGYVQVPCIVRNMAAVPTAVTCANAALAGMDHIVPLDDVVALMLAVGEKIRPCDEAGTYILKKEEA